MKNSNTYQFYKSKYLIAFYDSTGEDVVKIFDNLREILVYKNIEINSNNLKKLRLKLYRALIRDNHYTKMLNGTLMTVWIIDVDDTSEV